LNTLQKIWKFYMWYTFRSFIVFNINSLALYCTAECQSGAKETVQGSIEAKLGKNITSSSPFWFNESNPDFLPKIIHNFYLSQNNNNI
jgi:hypothetical protein